MLLLRTGDPYLSAMYQKHLRARRKGKQLQRTQNFYERMQMDIVKRTQEQENLHKKHVAFTNHSVQHSYQSMESGVHGNNRRK